MNKIKIADVTLKEKAMSLSFKEKIEVARQLDKLNVDIVETPCISGGKTDVLFLHTISPIICNSIVSCPVGLSRESIENSYNAIKTAKKPRLNLVVPVSTVQMEYISHLKPGKVLELLEELTAFAVELCGDVEVSFADSTRAEEEFLLKAIKTAVDNGAKTVTICDSAGVMLPEEFAGYIKRIFESVPELENVTLSVECSDELKMAVACAVSCITAGVGEIKTVTDSKRCPSLKSIAKVFREKSNLLGVETNINTAVLENSVKRIRGFISGGTGDNLFSAETVAVINDDVKLNASDDVQTISGIIEKMGYELSDDDIASVFDEFHKIATKKTIGIRELDAIIASTAMQVAPTYKLKSYVINNGNVFTPTASIELIKSGELLHGFSIGDGPVDAAFMAIEQITGHHYELDDFQIQAVTRGREAMGESIVKLRHEGKLYSGKGTSTDVIGASISAYINALNKICFEEAM